MLQVHADKDYRRKARKAQATARREFRPESQFYSRKGRQALEELRYALHEYALEQYVPKANS